MKTNLIACLAFSVLAIGVAGKSASAALIHQWKFDGNTNDSVGTANGTLSGGATVTGGRLVLDGVNDQMLTSASGNSISAKTLVSWVSLNNLTQSGGSALSIQTVGGGVFDGIVFNELGGSRWMAGSNNYDRTQNPQTYGTAETVTEPGEVMMAIVYAVDNSITLYRNGSLYGTFTKGTLQTYPTTSEFIFGLRHTGGGGAPLNAFINEARVYNTALSATEVAALVPEPASISLAAIAGMAMIRVRRRRV